MDIVNEDAKRASVDKETELEVIKDRMHASVKGRNNCYIAGTRVSTIRRFTNENYANVIPIMKYNM